LSGQQHLRRESRSGRTRHGSVALRTALTEAAHAAARTKNTYLAAHHAHIRGCRGLPKAIGATRHDLLIAYWHVVHDQVDYADLSPDWAQRRRSTEQSNAFGKEPRVRLVIADPGRGP
jgi:transposase